MLDRLLDVLPVVLPPLAGWLAVLSLVPWYFVAVRRGLVPRRKDAGRVDLAGSCIVFYSRKEHWEIPLAHVHHVRLAIDPNWDPPWLVEDGVTLFCACGRRLARFGASAAGFGEVVATLKRRAVPMDRVEVDGPGFSGL